MTPTPTTQEQAREELAKVSSLVLTARRLVAGGTLVDLSAIEDRVRALCDIIARMPRDEGKALLADMTTLIRKLDHLSIDLRERLAKLADPPSLPDDRFKAGGGG